MNFAILFITSFFLLENCTFGGLIFFIRTRRTKMENRRRKMQKTRVRSQKERRKRTTRRRMRVKRVKQRRRRKKRLRRLGIARRVTRRMRRRRIVRLNSVPPIFLRRLPRRPSRDLEMIIKPQHVHTKPCHHNVDSPANLYRTTAYHAPGNQNCEP